MRSRRLPVVREALHLVLALGAGTLLAAWLLPLWTAAPILLLAVFTLWFFRDPERVCPSDPDALVAPADGRIIRAGPDRLSIFMNVFDVHVCRAPHAGTVASVRHSPGRFLAAFRDDAPSQNERTEIRVDGEGVSLGFTLIAGLVARRIVCWVKPGQRLATGQRIGLIRFGSRVDVELPAGAAVRVALGDRVKAGESVVARLAAPGGRGAPQT